MASVICDERDSDAHLQPIPSLGPGRRNGPGVNVSETVGITQTYALTDTWTDVTRPWCCTKIPLWVISNWTRRRINLKQEPQGACHFGPDDALKAPIKEFRSQSRWI